MKDEGRRTKKYKDKVDGSITRQRLEVLGESMKSLMISQTVRAVDIEIKVKQIVKDEPANLAFFYLAYAKEVWRVVERHGTNLTQINNVMEKWRLRGLRFDLMDEINFRLFGIRLIEKVFLFGGEVFFINFQEGAGNRAGDRTGNGNDAGLKNVTWNREKLGFSTYYNGTDAEAVIEPSQSIAEALNRRKGAFAIVLWEKRDAHPQQPFAGLFVIENLIRIGCADDGTGFNFLVNMEGDWRGLFKIIPSGFDPFIFRNAVFMGEWDLDTSQFLRFHFYCNGVHYFSFSIGTFTGFSFTNNLTKIGIDYGVTNNRFKGWIDNIRFFNRLLSEDEIKEIYEKERVFYGV
jgi:hypothetical protein